MTERPGQTDSETERYRVRYKLTERRERWTMRYRDAEADSEMERHRDRQRLAHTGTDCEVAIYIWRH